MAISVSPLLQILNKMWTVNTIRNTAITLSKYQLRNSSFKSSNLVKEIDNYPEVEVIKNPPEWIHVETLLPKLQVPKYIRKPEYSSGWKPPQNIDKINTKYCVLRNKNHMIPVYLQRKYRGTRRITIVKRIEGDIWSLEKDIREIAENHRGGLCATRINELAGHISIHGDYVNLIKNFLLNKGF